MTAHSFDTSNQQQQQQQLDDPASGMTLTMDDPRTVSMSIRTLNDLGGILNNYRLMVTVFVNIRMFVPMLTSTVKLICQQCRLV
jgi:hypothetical protein